MKRRYLYPLLFAVPALLAAVIVTVLLFGAAAGVLWIFVFGDNPWPAAAGEMLAILLIFAGLMLWLVLLAVAYRIGMAQEARADLNPRHLMTAVASTVLLVSLVLVHQWRVGNIGPPSVEVSCADYCRNKGFAGSGTPARNSGEATCSCFDGQGREAVKVPLAEVSGAGK